MSVVATTKYFVYRYINNTLSAFDWQRFLHTDLLRINDFLFAPLKNSLESFTNI